MELQNRTFYFDGPAILWSGTIHLMRAKIEFLTFLSKAQAVGCLPFGCIWRFCKSEILLEMSQKHTKNVLLISKINVTLTGQSRNFNSFFLPKWIGLVFYYFKGTVSPDYKCLEVYQ
jgi:hypothetical protein